MVKHLAAASAWSDKCFPILITASFLSMLSRGHFLLRSQAKSGANLCYNPRPSSPGESIQQIFEVYSTLLCEILVTPEITSSVNTIIQLILAPDSQPLSNEAHQQQPAAVLENYSQGKWKSSKLFHFYNRKSEYLMEVVSASLKWWESGTKVAQNKIDLYYSASVVAKVYRFGG